MTGLYIDISDYYTDPIEEEVERVIKENEEYDIIPSSSNFKNWGGEAPTGVYHTSAR